MPSGRYFNFATIVPSGWHFTHCVFYFYKIKWGGASPLPIPHSLEKFLFKKENNNVCELKARCTVNGIASELPMQRIGDLYCVF